MRQLFDFHWYAPNVFQIQTKLDGIRPFALRKIQARFFNEVKEVEHAGQPVRFISVKARQCGWSTGIAGFLTHKMQTNEDFKTIMLADKSGRTDEVFSIYERFVNLTPKPFRPMIASQNSREILFDNPNPALRVKNPGLRSGLFAETARDPYAGRSGTRRAAHLTEYAFYWYPNEVTEGVQNSIPMAPGTYIFKESTANGMAGDGEAFFLEWEAAVRGETVYRPFFVAWYEVDDYALAVPRGFVRTKEERDLIKLCPDITDANLQWRRAKLSESAAKQNAVFTPEEIFKQDYPSYPEEAFLNSGRPVFDTERVKRAIQELRNNPANPIEFQLKEPRPMLELYRKQFKLWEGPQPNQRYVIGADVAEGVEGGDFSHAFVMTKDFRQVALWHGHIDPDHFGKLLVELARIYNDALITPEINNMGHTTLNAIKEAGYLKVYMRTVYDEIADREQEKMGWRTTRANKLDLISRYSALFRDGAILIRDLDLLSEMMRVVRESDGDVELTGKDRVVAACLACMGQEQIYAPAVITDPDKKVRLHYETKDLSRDKILSAGSRASRMREDDE